MTVHKLPETTQEAFKSGQEARQAGSSIDCNPFRKLDNRINHLWDAWNRGWKSQDFEAGPDYPMVSE